MTTTSLLPLLIMYVHDKAISRIPVIYLGRMVLCLSMFSMSKGMLYSSNLSQTSDLLSMESMSKGILYSSYLSWTHDILSKFVKYV